MTSSQQQLRLALKPYIVDKIMPLAQGYIERGNFLSQQGWLATSPTIEWLQSYGDEKDWQEYMYSLQARAINILTLRCKSNAGTPVAETKIRLALEKVQYSDRKRFEHECSKQKDEIRFCYENEALSKLKGYCDGLDARKKTARYSLYKRVMKEELKDLGFIKSKDLSTPNVFIYAKQIAEQWSIGFCVDKQNLNEPYSHNFTLRLEYGLFHSSQKGSPNQDLPYILFYNELFYPINVCYQAAYEYGETLLDLELFLLAHIDMYKNIHSDFESMLLSLLEAADLL